MSSEITLGEMADIIMGQSPAGESCNIHGVGVPLLNGPTEFGPKHPYPNQYTVDPKKQSKKDDLLFCVRGSTTGKMNWADQPYAIGRGIAAISGKNGYPNSFIRAVIELKLESLLIKATGSTFPNVNKELLHTLRLPFVSPTRAQEIARIVEAIDNRISLFRDTNTTLEAIAQALFKSWFIDFDPIHAKAEGRKPEGMDAETEALFPDGFEESDLGSVPKGWKPSTVGESFTLTMGQSPPSSTYNDRMEGVPFYQGRTDFGFRFPCQRVYCSSPGRLAERGDILISVRAPVGDVNVALEKCCLGRGVAGIRHKENYQSFALYSLKNLRSYFEFYQNEGTVFGSINKNDFQRLPVISSSKSVMEAFDNIASKLDDRIRVNEEKMRTLIGLRDILLPQLISGRLQLPENNYLPDGET